jgi:hypothetical protein
MVHSNPDFELGLPGLGGMGEIPMTDFEKQGMMVRLFFKVALILLIVFVMYFYVEIATRVRTDWISATATYGAEQFRIMMTALAQTPAP